MHIGNNLLTDLKKNYINELLDIYSNQECEQLLTILIEHYFDISRYDLILKPNYRLTESEILKIHLAVKELKKFKPVQYITGIVEFHNLKFRVDSNVLIPRSETEELVQLIINREEGNNLVGIDIGTGSGCIAISLSSLLDKPIIHASDISRLAIQVSKKNAIINMQDIIFHHDDILDVQHSIEDNNGNKILFDFIVSNPPYVTQIDKNKMQSNVLNYEPHSALFVSDNNPLIYYDAILKFANNQLRPGGRIYLEINESLGSQMVRLLEKYMFLDIELIHDLNGRDRFIVGLNNNNS